MGFIRLMRWLRGTVLFSIRAGSAERFLSQCAHHHVRLWNCRREDAIFLACVGVSGYRRIRLPARKAGVVLRVRERHGLPFLIHRYRKRVGIAAGALLCAVFFAVTQQFIWTVRVEGNERLDAQVYIRALEELGVQRGSLKNRLDARQLALDIQLEVEDLSWAALNIQGTTVTLLVRERIAPPLKIDSTIPANVIAARDGQLTRLMVTDGKTLCKKGDTVCAGDILVSGVNQDRWGMTRLTRANAAIFARVPETLTVEIPLQQEHLCSAGRVVKRRYLELAGLRVPLFLYRGLEGEYKLEKRTETPELFGISMPFQITWETYIFYNREEEQISPETALLLAQRTLTAKEQEKWSEQAIVRRETAAQMEQDVLTLRGDYLVEMDIAKQVEIIVMDRKKEEKNRKIRDGGY